MRVYIDINLQGSKLKQFIEFIKNISNSYSIARDFNGSLPDDIMQRLNNELKERFLQEDIERREKYTKNPEYRKLLNDCLRISNTEEAIEYFDNILSQEMQMVDGSISFSGKDHRFETMCDELIEVRYTRDTLVTRGGIFEVCYFSYGPMLSEILLHMNSLFELPYRIESYQFMDLAFYNGNEVKLAICSHEQHAYMELNEEEFNEFLTLDIPYETECLNH